MTILPKSSSRIQLLPAHEAQKIAAGEVVERPASVVKELIENSLDAGATTLDIRLKNAGKDHIRIIDNGCGMSAEDARLCTLQYATSKIRSVEELHTLATFGFRGEALASIAAIAHLTLITKDENSPEGLRINYKDNQQLESLVAAPLGTDITVDNLFYNVPARKKFLKKSETEWRQITTLVHAIALNHPEVHISVTHDGSQAITCPPSSSRINRMAHLWGTEHAEHMLTFSRNNATKSIAIRGIISNHQFNKFDRGYIFLFVNNRWIKNPSLSKALLKGYMNVLPQGRYPAACIHIDLDPGTVDINVHPRKEEVQFLHPVVIEQMIQAGVQETLEMHLSSQLRRTVSFSETSQSTSRPSFGQPATVISQPLHKRFISLFNDPFPLSEPQEFPSYINQPLMPQSPTTMFADVSVENTALSPEFSLAQSSEQEVSFDIIGYYQKTYILLERSDGLFIIDQHAAHERVLYEQFRSRFTAPVSTTLLFPVAISVTADELSVLLQHPELLASNGIMAEQSGSKQITITATPVCLKDQSLEDIVRNLAAWLLQEKEPSREELHTLINKKLHAQMACKAAVKAGDILTMDQIKQLLKDLYATPHRFTCPHGRPTGWLLSQYEIEKKFKRKI
jgi:DNA mismatch repair protein MutL